MKKLLFLLFITHYSLLIACLPSGTANAQLAQDWVQRYNGIGNSADGAYSIAVDGSGNVYVTGRSYGVNNYDYATLKYNTSGIQQWVSRYNGPGNSTDYGNSIAVDGSGNVYVTGTSVGSGTFGDYATIKYNSSGVQQWVQRYNGPVNGADYGNSIAVDGSGNVYVTGGSAGSGTQADYATIKYNSSGVQQWVSRYSSSGTPNITEARSIAVDGSGNVYVTGGSIASGTGNDYATIKYNSFGDSVWVRRYNGPGNSNDHATSIVIDGFGNVYVTGLSFGSGTNSDYATIKYNSAGVQQWVSRYNGPGNSVDEAYSLAVDGSGNVYVTGRSMGSGTYFDYATIKYNSSGVQQWAARYIGLGGAGNDEGTSLAMDGSGNVYVTGMSQTGTGSDYVTIKYNSSGVQQWLQRYGQNGGDIAYSLAVDGSGGVYVTGQSLGNATDYDYATIKYVQTPTSSPNLFSPPNNSQGWGLTVLLVWYRVPNTTTYHVQVSTDSLFNTLILNDSTVTDSTRTVSGLINNTYYFWRVAAKNVVGTGPWSAVWKFRTGFVGIKPVSNEIPKEFKLYDNYPNPFNPTTKIRFALPKSSFAKLVVYDALGREVSTLVNEQLKPGTYEADWNAKNFSSGVYIYKLAAGEFVDTKKMVLTR
jgi:type IX secretion system substrate protein/beta-propeller repeat-containing protein